MSSLKKKIYIFADKIEFIVLGLFIVMLTQMFLFRSVRVYGSSMEKTLFNGDRLFISDFLYTVKTGDVLVVNSENLNETIIKRAVAVGGQKVVIYPDDGAVYVDGIRLKESYADYGGKVDTDRFSDVFFNKAKGVYEYEVPVGYVFVMGDNRNESTDSRKIGFVSNDEVVGKVIFRFYSKKAAVGRI